MAQEFSLELQEPRWTKLDRPKTIDSEVVLPALEISFVCKAEWVSGDFGISQSVEYTDCFSAEG